MYSIATLHNNLWGASGSSSVFNKNFFRKAESLKIR